MRIPIIGGVKSNGGNIIKGSRLMTGKISPVLPDAHTYPEGMTAIKYELEGKTYVGISALEGRFNMDRVLRLMKLLELYNG